SPFARVLAGLRRTTVPSVGSVTKSKSSSSAFRDRIARCLTAAPSRAHHHARRVHFFRSEVSLPRSRSHTAPCAEDTEVYDPDQGVEGESNEGSKVYEAFSLAPQFRRARVSRRPGTFARGAPPSGRRQPHCRAEAASRDAVHDCCFCGSG